MQDSTSNQHRTRANAAASKGLDERIVQPAVEPWYQSLCLGDPRYDTNQQPAAADHSQYYTADNARSPDAGTTGPGGLFEDSSKVPPAHRQSGEQTSHPAQYSQPYYQPLGNNLFEQQRFYQPAESAPALRQAAPPHSSRVRKTKRRSGRSIPPSLSDPRWNIWTLGNLNIRHTNGGVTVKHLQQVLYDMDGNKRTKYDYQGLMKLIVDRRTSAKRMAPKGWSPEQGWWVHFDL